MWKERCGQAKPDPFIAGSKKLRKLVLIIVERKKRLGALQYATIESGGYP